MNPDYKLLKDLGFNPRECMQITEFAKTRDLSVKSLIRQAVRAYHDSFFPKPDLGPKGCPDLSD